MNGGFAISSTIGRVKGVDRYVLVDDRGNILAHDMDGEGPAIPSKLIYLWGQSLSALGGKNFKCASLLRTNNRDVLMFPVGNYYLGVVKQAEMDNAQLAESVIEFLARLSYKRE